MFRLSETGSSVVSGLVAGALTSAVIYSSLKILGLSQRIERGISTNVELSEIRDSLNQFLADEASCRKTLIPALPAELDVDPDHADASPITVSLPNLNQGGRQITGLYFSSPLTRLDVPPLAANPAGPLYFAVLNVMSQGKGAGTFVRRGNFAVNLKLVIEPGTNKVLTCYQSHAISIPPGPPCPAGRVVIGIAADGALRCGNDESTPDVISDWVAPGNPLTNYTATINFPTSLGTTEYRVAPEIVGQNVPNWQRCDPSYGCPSTLAFLGFVQGCTQPSNSPPGPICNPSQCGLCASFISHAAGSQGIGFGAGVVNGIAESNAIWSNKQPTSIDVSWVGDRWTSVGLSAWQSNVAAQWMRVRVYKYPGQ